MWLVKCGGKHGATVIAATYHFSQMFSNTEELWSQPGFFITNDGKFLKRYKCAHVYLYKWRRYKTGRSIIEGFIRRVMNGNVICTVHCTVPNIRF